MASGGSLKRWNGSTFKTGGSLKRWDGTQFKTGGTLRRWTGYEFVPDPNPGTISLSNTAEGGTNGTAVTNASQTGGGSGDAFSGLATGSNISFSNTQVFRGSLAYNLTETAGNQSGFYWTIPSPTELYARAYFYFTGYGSSSNILFDAYDAPSIAKITMAGTGGTPGQLRLINQNSQIANTTAALALNTWYRLEFHVKVSTTVGAIEIRAYTGSTHNMAAAVSSTGINTGSAPPTQIRIGSNATQSVPTMPTTYLDDIAYGTGGWLGP